MRSDDNSENRSSFNRNYSPRDRQSKQNPLNPGDESLSRTWLAGPGRLMMGLGTLGVLAYTQNQEGKTEPDIIKTIESVRGMARTKATPAAPEDQIIKRKLFQNLQEMFNLQPEPKEPGQAEDRPGGQQAPSRKQDSADKEKHVFERLVVGDKLVLREGDITKDQWKALSAFLASCPHITSLRLQGMEISAQDADELGKGLNQIRNITFCDNSIGLHEGSLERLVALLLCCGLLESTSIIRNSLGDDHIPHLVTLLKRHERLTRLSLSWNGITDRGATQIASAIAILNSSLTDLDLSYNSIGAEGQFHLREASRKRLEFFGHLLCPLNVNVRHNEPLYEFKREYKENLDAAQAEPPWYIRRAFFAKDNLYPKPLKKLRI